MQTMELGPERLLSRNDVEAVFGLSKRFLEVSAVRGDGPPMIKIGRSVRYRVADLKSWISARQVASTSETAPR